MKIAMIMLALAFATPARAETAAERFDRCWLQSPRDMSADCSALRSAINARVLACLDAQARPGLSQLAQAPASASQRSRARHRLCLSQAAAQFRN